MFTYRIIYSSISIRIIYISVRTNSRKKRLGISIASEKSRKIPSRIEQCRELQKTGMVLADAEFRVH